jgi:hypothetical protein
VPAAPASTPAIHQAEPESASRVGLLEKIVTTGQTLRVTSQDRLRHLIADISR